MIKRTLLIESEHHLSIKNEQLILLNKESGEIKSVCLDDVGFIVLDNIATTYTGYLFSFLAQKNIAVCFCDKNHTPSTMLLNLNSNTTQAQTFIAQAEMKDTLKNKLWKQTIQQKIQNQANFLKFIGKNDTALRRFVKTVKTGDSTNREAQASKYYWNELFTGMNFTRERYGDPPNNFLNYGYAVIRAVMARAIAGSGLHPTLGIKHSNKYNAFCLADDLMEPYRVYVDDIVMKYIEYSKSLEITKEFKKVILKLPTRDCKFKNVTRPLMIAMTMTSASLVKCALGENEIINYPEFLE